MRQRSETYEKRADPKHDERCVFGDARQAIECPERDALKRDDEGDPYCVGRVSSRAKVNDPPEFDG